MATGEEDTQVKMMKQLYPKLLTDPYFVPPVYFNRVPWRQKKVHEKNIPVVDIASSEPPPRTSSSDSCQSPQSAQQDMPDFPLPPQAMYETVSYKVGASDTQGNVGAYQTREDFSQQHVLLCLQKLFAQKQASSSASSSSSSSSSSCQTESEPLFVVSQLGFDMCVKKTDDKKSELLQTQRLRGDFDILLIHRACGVLIGEIKAVGLSDADDSPNSLEEAVVKRVLKAAKQLSKSVKVVKHMAEDIYRDLIVRTTLILPYVSRSQLQEILSRHSNKDLVKTLCNSLGAADLDAALQLCLCEDDLSHRDSYWDISSETVVRLRQWWESRMTKDEGKKMTDDIYKKLAARVCGLVTTIPVYLVNSPRLVMTRGHAVSELGRRLSFLMLTQSQLDLLNRAPPAVCLTGPPGTGKSILLVIKGLIAVRQEDCTVVVLSTTPFSLAVSKLICEQLRMTLSAEDEGKELTFTGQGTADLNIPDTADKYTTEAPMAEHGAAEQTTPVKNTSYDLEEDVFMTKQETEEEEASPAAEVVSREAGVGVQTTSEQGACMGSQIVKKPRTSGQTSVVASKTGHQKTVAEANMATQKAVEESTAADSKTVGESSMSDPKTPEESRAADQQGAHILHEAAADDEGDRPTIHHPSVEAKAYQSSLVKRVRFLPCDLREKPEAEVLRVIEEMEKMPCGKLCVLMDEAAFVESELGSATRELVRELLNHPSLGNRLTLWAACIPNSGINDPEQKNGRRLTIESLTQPLRSAPRICRAIQAKIVGNTNVDDYDSNSAIPSPADDLHTIKVHHRHGHGGHEGTWPIECKQCGRELARILREELRVGVPDPITTTTARNPEYRDVFVLTRSNDLHEENPDKQGGTQPASGIVQGLRDKGLPVGVLPWRRDNKKRWYEELGILALAKKNQVTVARWRAVDGLERKIVAYVPGRDETVDKKQSWSEVKADDYLRLVSRCSTQLIKITMPEIIDA